MAPNNEGKKPGGNASALKRLKESLKTAGLIGPTAKTQHGKKKHRQQRALAHTSDVGLRADRKKKLAQVESAMNPFEMKLTRQKHEVIGRKTKGVTGRPTVTKQVGEEKRRQTLLVEMQRKTKAGGIVDRRFGENDPTMSLEDKMLERFTKERQRQSRGRTFNLEADSDGDDDGLMGLTHMGKSLADMDEFDDYGLAVDDDDGSNTANSKGAIDRDTVSQLHFGGFEPVAAGAQKTRAEIMKEVIAKSKMHKYERQQEKEVDEALRRKLDEDLGSIQSLLFAAAPSDGSMLPTATAATTRRALPSQSALFGKAQALNEEAQDKAAAADEESNEKKKDDNDKSLNYDMLVRELASDRRAHATDRLKTEAELAQEEKEKLEKAERHRKRRMAGDDSDTEDERESTAAKKRRKGHAPQGDDIEDDFVLDEDLVDPTGFGTGLKQVTESGSEDDEDEDEESEDEEEDSDDDEESEDSQASDLEEDEEEDEISSRKTTNAKTSTRNDNEVSDNETDKRENKLTAQREVPYTFSAPEDHKAFLSLVRGYDADKQDIVVKRLRTIYHVSLGAGNRDILQQLLVILLDHVIYCGSLKTPQVAVVNQLFPHIYALATQFPEVATEHARKVLFEWQSNMVTGMTEDDSDPVVFPSSQELLFLMVIMRLFPTSDKLHPVITPVFLYIGQCLAQMPVRTDRDVLSGLFMCQLYIESQSISKRIMPEVFNYLYRLLAGLLLKSSSSSNINNNTLPGYFSSAISLPDTWSLDIANDDHLSAINPIAIPMKCLSTKQRTLRQLEPVSTQIKVSAFFLILRLIQQLAELATGSTAFPELFRPAIDLLQPLKQGKWSDTVITRITAVIEQLERMIKLNGQSRKPLQLQRHRPMAIASHQPKFEENYSVDKHYDPDRERAEVQRLRAQHRKERKGAMRELRRDNQFIATERAREQKEKDDAYKRKIRHITGLLTDEQGEKNKQERKARK